MMRRTPLRNRRAEIQAQRVSEPGRREWKAPHRGHCAACGEYGDLVRHHVVYLTHLRGEAVAPELLYDQRNALDLGMWCKCHARQHSGAQRLARSIIPPQAVEFAVEALGEAAADYYFRRYYDDR